jgi:hypothetical protein
VADLNGPLTGALVGLTHFLRVIDGERHGLFLVNVLARVKRGDEVLAVQVLGRGDQDGINRFILEQVAVIEVGLGVWCDLFGVFQPASVDIGERDELGIRARHRFPHDLHPAIAGSDDPEPDPLVRAEDVTGCGDGGADPGSHPAKKFTSGIHGGGVLLLESSV